MLSILKTKTVGKNDYYNRYSEEKRWISLVTLVLGIIGVVLDYFTNGKYYDSTILTIFYVTIVVLVVALIGSVSQTEQYRQYFVLGTWGLVLNIVFSQFNYPDTSFYTDNFEQVLIRNVLFLTAVITLTAVMGTLVHFRLQVGVLFSLLIYYAFNSNTPFIAENLGVLLVSIFGLFGIVLFFIKYQNKFVQDLLIQRKELERKNKEITDNITYARRIQKTILPADEVLEQKVKDAMVYYKPKSIVAGDFYWFVEKDENFYIAVADCTGHGVSGAFVSLVCNNALNRAVNEYDNHSPGEVLTHTRDLVLKRFEKGEEGNIYDGMDIGLCALQGNVLNYSGANISLWLIRDGEIIEYKADKQPIGVYVASKPFTTHRVEVQEGDCFYLFTDGYIDQFGGERGKKFKIKAFKKLLLSISNKPMKEQKVIIDKTFQDWKGDLDQVDDVCGVGFRVV